MVHRDPGTASRRTNDGAAAARRTVPRGRTGLAPSRVPVSPRAEETEAPSIVRKPRFEETEAPSIVRKARSEEPQEPGLAERRSERPLIAAPGSALHHFRERATGPGQPLDVRTRASMERRHGKDFGRVRVHTEAATASLARGVGALAFTAGSEIAFAPGMYAPHTTAGRRLIDHELGHVADASADSHGAVWRQTDPAAPDGAPAPVDVPVGSSHITFIPGPGPLRLEGVTLPLPASLRVTNALGAGPGPTAVADLDAHRLVLSILDGIDLSAAPVQGAPPGQEHPELARVRLIDPQLQFDLRSGRLSGWATLHVPSSYPAALHPGTDLRVSFESEGLDRLHATASYGPLVADGQIRMHYELGRLLSAATSGVGAVGRELTHPGLSVDASLHLGPLPLTHYTLDAPTTVPRKQPLPGAPTSFPSTQQTSGVILAPAGSVTSVAAPAGGFTRSSYGERGGYSATAALLPTVDPSATGGVSHLFPVHAFVEFKAVRRISDGFVLDVRAYAQLDTSQLGAQPPSTTPPWAQPPQPATDPTSRAVPPLPSPLPAAFSTGVSVGLRF